MNVETSQFRVRYFLRLFHRIGLRDEAAAWLHDPEDHAFWRTPSGRRSKWRVNTMPADGWLLLSKLIQQDVHGPQDGIRRGATDMNVRAMQEITAAVNLRRRHPAVHRLAISGVSGEVVTAWIDENNGLHPFAAEAPTPEEHTGLVLVAPYYEMGVTRWRLTRDVPAGVDARLGEPFEHLKFGIPFP